MKEKNIFTLTSAYRDDFRVRGYEFGSGEKSACIVGSFRGNEIQQMFCCSQLVSRLKKLEEEGRIEENRSILVIPCANNYSMNIEKRFWGTDNTDINRMFPGYNLGETTQRIADAVFKAVQDYEHGIQFASFYIPGNFMPHVRMMKTGYENTDLAQEFGLPYIVLRMPMKYDSTTLNYNWQIWETNAFSVYTNHTGSIDTDSMEQVVQAVLRFLEARGIIRFSGSGMDTEEAVPSTLVSSGDLIPVLSHEAGIFYPYAGVNQKVSCGEKMACILDPYDSSVKEEIAAPFDGTVFFRQNKALAQSNSVLFRVIRG
ncbi:MAG: M14 family metallopeptidase [Lachnospiraceae bacterium]|nr:M14 family metallopeptidase [Lachnospiraceae bacterium]